MDSDIINDLKQFITTTVSQQLSLQLTDFEERINTRFETVERRFDKKLEALEASINGTINVYATAIQENFDDHDRRIKKLEARRA